MFPTTVTDVTRRKDFQRAGIAFEDASGHVVDLHAMRTTLGTRLARQGTAPQIAQRIMRHSDYRTTQKHYVVLGLVDTAGAIEKLPSIESPQRATATGTCDSDPQQIPQQSEHNSQPRGATQCESAPSVCHGVDDRQPLPSTRLSDEMREDATGCEIAGDRIRTDDVQLGKLAFYH